MASGNAICIVCQKGNSKLCGQCQGVSYCSRACQVKEWRAHKLFCKEYSNFKATKRPSQKHFLAILFPVNDSEPKGVWVKKGEFYTPDVKSLLGGNTPIGRSPIQFNPVVNRQLTDSIYICYRDEFLFDGSEPNKCIASITALRPGAYTQWLGPIVAYGMVGHAMDPRVIRDLTMADFKHITDYFISYRYGTQVSLVKGVRINCDGDRELCKRPPFEAVEVSPDILFSDQDTSSIAERMGLPIFVRKYSPDPKWEADPSAYGNSNATFLHMCCDPKSEWWGWAPLHWRTQVGSVFVIRQDKKPLLPLHVEALCHYCREFLQPAFEDSLGGSGPENEPSKKHVLSMINKSKFLYQWGNFLSERNCKDVPSPYDIS
ncbi:unnamed protein product [Bemisia tabaci]|uniref:MYND-type domain-containing protein n=1 Tax=Bemisia tabaci TaxID=7038 RepID=A0A9P0AMZ9_BEMTA|nr:unnamed protein product [Bemisia tabaci]